MSRIRRTSALALIAGLGLTALAGCTGGGSDAPATSNTGGGSGQSEQASSQTEAEACDTILPVLLDVNSELNEVYAGGSGDPTTALATLEEQVSILQDLEPEVTNETVAPVYSDFVMAMSDFTDQISAAAADPANLDMEAYTAGAEAVSEAGSELDSTCQAAS